MTHARRGSDGGETLVEVLVALLVISLTVVAVMGGLAQAMTASAKHRGLSTADTILRSAAEIAKYNIDLQPSPWFAECAATTSTSYNGSTIQFSPPSGYGVAISGIKYWNTTTQSFVTATSATCSATPADQSGFQLLELTATLPSGETQSMSIGMRSPS